MCVSHTFNPNRFSVYFQHSPYRLRWATFGVAVKFRGMRARARSASLQLAMPDRCNQFFGLRPNSLLSSHTPGERRKVSLPAAHSSPIYCHHYYGNMNKLKWKRCHPARRLWSGRRICARTKHSRHRFKPKNGVHGLCTILFKVN